ncbi:MAG: hypothetical protein HY319_30845 [Armatimonadetes bacterium]|nr:hypothetical protein [Armatimonadota bacterium]
MAADNAIQYLLELRNRRQKWWRRLWLSLQVLLALAVGAGFLWEEPRLFIAASLLLHAGTALWCYCETLGVASMLSNMRRQRVLPELQTTRLRAREVLGTLRNECFRQGARPLPVPVMTAIGCLLVIMLPAYPLELLYSPMLSYLLKLLLQQALVLAMFIVVPLTAMTFWHLAAEAWRREGTSDWVSCSAAAAAWGLPGVLCYQFQRHLDPGWILIAYYGVVFPAMCWKLALMALEPAESGPAVRFWRRASKKRKLFLVNPLVARALVPLTGTDWLPRVMLAIRLGGIAWIGTQMDTGIAYATMHCPAWLGKLDEVSWLLLPWIIMAMVSWHFTARAFVADRAQGTLELLRASRLAPRTLIDGWALAGTWESLLSLGVLFLAVVPWLAPMGASAAMLGASFGFLALATLCSGYESVMWCAAGRVRKPDDSGLHTVVRIVQFTLLSSLGLALHAHPFRAVLLLGLCQGLLLLFYRYQAMRQLELR